MPYYVDVRYINAVSRKEIECFKGLSCLHASLLIPTEGFLKYKGKWNLFAQIVLSGNLIGDDRSTLKLYKTEIFSRGYMFQQEGRYKGNTKRTHAGGVWLNGYSDLLPVIVYLLKETKKSVWYNTQSAVLLWILRFSRVL